MASYIYAEFIILSADFGENADKNLFSYPPKWRIYARYKYMVK